MIIHNETLLSEFRTPGKCDWCGKACAAREGHHLFSKGAGRIDARWNLACLGKTLSFQCQCHSKHHQGLSPTAADLILMVADREKTNGAAIVDAMFYIRALDKNGQLDRPRELDAEARKLVDAALKDREPVTRRKSRKIRSAPLKSLTAAQKRAIVAKKF